jgi:NAD(P)H-flavin reductase/ferredoxin
MSFQISVQDTPNAFPCEPNESVLDATQRAGYEVPFSCRKGVCGTCKGRLVSGEARAFAGDALGDADKAAGNVLFCNARPRSDLVIAPRSIARIDPFSRKTVTARVFRIARVAEDVAHVHLRFPAGIRVRFKAGQHLNLILPNGERRDFSMANPPSESDGVQLHVRHVAGGAITGYVFNELKRGDQLRVEVPFGDFYLRDSERPALFVAGSTGFAPIAAMVADALAKGSRREMLLYWGARRRSGLYSDLPAKWQARHPNFRYVPVISDETVPGLRHGLVHRAVLEDFPSLAAYQVYACGVPVMTQAARRDFVQAGLPDSEFFAVAFVTRADLAAAGP